MTSYTGVMTKHPEVDKLSVAQQILLSATSGLTALAGGGQTGATPLASLINRISTVATTADSCQLPIAKAGNVILLKNAGANSTTVYPYLGDAINALSANAGYAVATVKAVLFFCAIDGTWETLLTA